MKITFEELTTIPAAVAIRLTPKQAAARSHALEQFGDDAEVFVGTQALQFKTGESVEIIGDLPKGILPVYDRLRDLEGDSGSGELDFVEPPLQVQKPSKKSKTNEQTPI